MKLKVLLFPAWLGLTASAVLGQGAVPASSDSAAPAASARSAAAPMPEMAPADEPNPIQPAKKAAVKKRIPFDPPASALVKSDAVNVRGQPGFNGEVLGHLKKGDTVTVEAEITLRHPQKGEPAQWSQIALPADTAVWVDSQFIDSDAKTVKARRINLRGGPGENYSIVGRLEKGAAITEIRHKNGWLAIQPPANASAFVAAGFLDVQPAASPEAPPPVAPAAPVAGPAPAVTEPAPAAPPPASVEPAPAAPAPTSQSQADQELAALRRATDVRPAPTPAPAAPVVEVPAATPAATPASTPGAVTPRIVTREGYVHRSYNVQAPSHYELHDIQTDRLIEYLQPTANMNLHAFVGTRVSVTGPELLDQRWPRTPILQVQSVDLIP